MSRQYDAKQYVLKAYPNDRENGVELFREIMDCSEDDFKYEEGKLFEEYIYGDALPSNDNVEKLAAFLDALGEWGCQDNFERSKQIIDFQKTGYDLSEYVDEEEYRRGQEADYLAHVSMLRREGDWQ